MKTRKEIKHELLLIFIATVQGIRNGSIVIKKKGE
jgi:hypothetical protein